MFYLIYKITNNVDNKIYVGKHKTQNKNDDYFGSGLLLKRAIEKYGIDKFKKEILFECLNEEELNQKEKDIVNEEFIARLDTYNIKLGGQGGFDYINDNKLNIYENHSNQSKENIKKATEKSKKLFEDKSSDWYKERCKKVSNGLLLYYSTNLGHFTGLKHTNETKRKIAEKNKHLTGDRNSQFGTCWVHIGTRNKKIKKEDIQKYISQGWLKGRKIK